MNTKFYKNNNSVGGYFELELNKGKEFHKDAISLNTGRNCLEYILRVRNYKKVYIPYFTCDVILEPFKKTDTKFEFYNINIDLEPCDIELKNNEALLYTNYFGIKGNAVKKLSKKFKNVIIDNSQAFFDKPLTNIDTFYSPRKFFGVPDGGYLYINEKLNNKFDKDLSYMRFSHLLKRIDISAECGYNDFIQNDGSLINQPIKLMSNLTKRVLESVEYEKAKKIRIRNFEYLHKNLSNINELEINSNLSSPMVYPLFINKFNLREKLIRNKIYVARYWNNVINWTKNLYIESELTNYLVPLPIDQRYNLKDLNIIVKLIRKYI